MSDLSKEAAEDEVVTMPVQATVCLRDPATIIKERHLIRREIATKHDHEPAQGIWIHHPGLFAINVAECPAIQEPDRQKMVHAAAQDFSYTESKTPLVFFYDDPETDIEPNYIGFLASGEHYVGSKKRHRQRLRQSPPGQRWSGPDPRRDHASQEA